MSEEYKQEGWLRHKYLVDDLTQSEIADIWCHREAEAED